MSNEGTMVFELLKSTAGDGVGARLGRLVFPGRAVVQTPNFFAATSRGVVPHLSPDNVSRYNVLAGAYMGLEDCMLSSHDHTRRP